VFFAIRGRRPGGGDPLLQSALARTADAVE
jgi:hypothetical protein